MWIEIEDEIEKDLNKINNPFDKKVVSINTLLDSMLKGLHIVFLSREMINKLCELPYISETNKCYMKWILKNYVKIYSGGRNVIESKIIVLTGITEIKKIGMNYRVPLEFFFNIKETKLLTENESDGSLFVNIYRAVFEKIDKINSLYDIKLENDACHGSNVVSKIKQCAKDDRLAICILDSDKDMQGSRRGDTFQGANNAFKKIQNKHIIHLELLKSREKENLFPPSIYILLYKEHPAFLDVLKQFENDEKIMRFFDFKDGIKYKKYRLEDWKKYYNDVINLLIQNKIFKFPKSESLDDEFICVDGLGEKICETVSHVVLGEDSSKCQKILQEKNIPDRKKKQIEKVQNNITDYLPSFIMEEWRQISKLLFNWGCCIANKEQPRYRMDEVEM